MFRMKVWSFLSIVLLPFCSLAQTNLAVRDCTVTNVSHTYSEAGRASKSTRVVYYSEGKPIYSVEISYWHKTSGDSAITWWTYDANGRPDYILTVADNDSLPDDTIATRYHYGNDGRLVRIIKTSAHHSVDYPEVQRGSDTTLYFDKMVVNRGWKIFEDRSLAGMARIDTTEYYDNEQRIKKRLVMYTDRGLERSISYSYVYSDAGALIETNQIDTIAWNPVMTLKTRWAYHNTDTFAIYYLSFAGRDSANMFESIGSYDSSYTRFVQKKIHNRQFTDSTVVIRNSVGNMTRNMRYDKNGTLQFDSRIHYSTSKNTSEQWSFLDQPYRKQLKHYSRVDTVYTRKGYTVIWSSAVYEGSETKLKSVPRRKCSIDQRTSYDRRGRVVLSEQFRKEKPIYKFTWTYSR